MPNASDYGLSELESQNFIFFLGEKRLFGEIVKNK